MDKKKSIVYTILFAIIIIGVTTAMIFIKLHGSEISLFHVFSPFFVGLWIGDIIEKFYKWVSK